MKLHHLTVEEAFASMQSRPEGLTEGEAARRLRESGPNEIEPVRHEPWVRRFLQGFTHFFAGILWLAAALAFFAETQEPGQGMLLLGFAIVGVILVNGTFSFAQEYRAERALEELQRLLPRTVKLKRDGSVREVAVSELVLGDVIFLEAGDRVPADCRVVEAFSLRVNNATITGESVPHSRGAHPSDEADHRMGANVLLAGTSVVSGNSTALVFATGVHTAFGQIANLTQTAREPLSPLQLEIVRLSRVVAALALALGFVFFGLGHALGLPFWSNFIFAIGIIVANVPEGLLPTLTLALALGSQRMAKRNALVRHLPAVETLGAATVICTDKTGTLTENRLTARRLWLGGACLEVSDLAGLRSCAKAHSHFFEIARQSHTLKRTVEGGQSHWLGDPLEIALVELAEAVAPKSIESPRLDEIPFDSRRRRMSTLHQSLQGEVLFLKGAPETVLPLCEQVELGNGTEPLSDHWRAEIMTAQGAFAEAGLRVLALAYRPLAVTGVVSEAGVNRAPSADGKSPESARGFELEEHLVFAGLIGLEDPIRPEVPAAMARCREAGIRVVMVTGDHLNTALAVARQTGVVTGRKPAVITGDQLGHLSNVQLQNALDAPEILFARIAADQKLRIVAALKRKNEVVAVTGDGVNDAPALKCADVGISMGRGGTDVAREAADLVLLDDSFATLVAAIEEGRTIYANIRKFLTYILTSNIPELVPYLAFVLFKIPLPLTIIQILAVDLGTDMVPALALGIEAPDPKTMRQPPRPRNERLLNFALLARAYLWLGLLQSVAALAAFFFVLYRGGWSYGDRLASQAPLYLQATTACLSAIIVMQIVNVFLCRSQRESVLSRSLGGNPLLLWGIGVEITLILLIDYTTWGNSIFGTAPISLETWLFMLPFALVMLFLEETRKWIMRRRSDNTKCAHFV